MDHALLASTVQDLGEAWAKYETPHDPQSGLDGSPPDAAQLMRWTADPSRERVMTAFAHLLLKSRRSLVTAGLMSKILEDTHLGAGDPDRKEVLQDVDLEQVAGGTLPRRARPGSPSPTPQTEPVRIWTPDDVQALYARVITLGDIHDSATTGGRDLRSCYARSNEAPTAQNYEALLFIADYLEAREVGGD